MRYFIVNSIKEGNRLIRRENKKNQQETIVGLLCCHLIDFAKEVVIQDMAKEGNLEGLAILENQSEVIVMQNILYDMYQNKKEAFFIPENSICFETAQEVLKSINQIRSGKVTETYQNTDDIKILQIKQLIKIYENQLEEGKQYDKIRLYQKALEILKEKNSREILLEELFQENLQRISKELSYKDTFDVKNVKKFTENSYYISNVCFEKLTYLERQFLEQYTLGTYQICNLFPKMEEQYHSVLKEAEFFQGYGMANEIVYVAEKIKNEKQPFGKTAVFYTSTAYEPFLEAVFGSKRISYRMTTRQQELDNRYIALMYAVLRWAEGNYDYCFLKQIVMCAGVHWTIEDENGEKTYRLYINAFYKTLRDKIGWGLESYKSYIRQKETEISDKKQNLENQEEIKKLEQSEQYVNFLKELVAIFSAEGQISYAEVYKKLICFVHKQIGSHQAYEVASTVWKQEMRVLEQMKASSDMKIVVRELLKRVAKMSWSDDEKTDAVLIAKLDENVRIFDREHIYCIGFSASCFGVDNTDSPVLSDNELKKYLNEEAGFIRLRKEQENKLTEALQRSISTYEKEETGTFAIGYCNYDTVKLKKEPPAVPYLRMLEIVEKEQEKADSSKENNIIKKENSIKKAEYQRLYKEAVKVSVKVEEEKDNSGQNETTVLRQQSTEEKNKYKLSTTSLQQLLNCPLQYYYQRIKYLPLEEYQESKPQQWLSPVDKGTLVHEIMERYCEEWFLKKEKTEIPSEPQIESFEKIMNQAVETMLEKVPYFSKAAYELECEQIKAKCQKYLIKMHKEFTDDKNLWKVIACEEKFEDLTFYYTENGKCSEETENAIGLCFEGYIDRIDGYQDEKNVWHFRVIDYKSGGKKKLEDKIKEGCQIQHIVYANAVKKLAMADGVAEENIKIDSVQYIHFFEDDKNNQVLEYSGEVLEDFPEKVRKVFVEVLREKHYRKLENCDCNNKKDKMLKETNCNYCTYKDICREEVGVEL